MTQKFEYDLESFTYIGQITEYHHAIVAKADAPFNTMEELIDYAKTNPLNFATDAMSQSYINFIGAQEGVTGPAYPPRAVAKWFPFF